MNAISKLGIYTLCLFMLSACEGITLGPALDPNVITNTNLKKSSFKEIKLISENISDAQDTRSFNARIYDLNIHSRLLMRISELNEINPSILDQYPTLVRIKSTTSTSAVTFNDLQICPIAKNWMMLSTWDQAHPYKNGAWTQPGSDFESDFCVTPLSPAEISSLSGNEKEICSEENSICFDVRPILTDIYRVNMKNYGFVILYQNENNLQIHGDQSPFQPILLWRRLR